MGMNEKDLKICDKTVKHTLDLLVREKRFALSGYALRSLSVDRIADYTYDNLLYSLHTLIPSEKMKEEKHTITVSYPATWWQALKEQYLSPWLKKRYPIKNKTKSETVTFTAYNLYPKFPDIMPERCIDAVQTIIKSVDYGAEDQ